MNLQTDHFNSYEMTKDELTNISVQSLLIQNMNLQTSQRNLYGEIKNEFTNISARSLLF
jgi:hypothetical protein